MGNRLYVGNLSFSTTEETIREAFQAVGDVTEVKLMLERETGRSRGFAFVEMASAQAATAAIDALHGSQLDGRSLRVSEAQERQPRGGGGGGYDRDRGGGGGGGGRGRGGRGDRW
jgi:RNA recognition motif-containing protein